MPKTNIGLQSGTSHIAKMSFETEKIHALGGSTHAGIPWLRYIRQHLKDRVHFWPFDGWTIPTNRSVVAEVYQTAPSTGFGTGVIGPFRNSKSCL